MLNVIVLGTVAIISLIYVWIRRTYSYFDDNGIQCVKPSLIYGNLSNIGKEHLLVTRKRVYDEYKKTKDVIGGFFFFTNKAFIIMDLDIVKDILIRDFSNFSGRGLYFNEKDDPLSAHLLSLEGAKWKHLRSKVSPTFTSGKMKFMFHTILQVGSELNKFWEPLAESKTDVEVKEVLSRYSTDVIGTCAFGIDCNTLVDPEAEFRRMGLKVFKQTTLQQLQMFLLFFFKDFSKKLGAKLIDKTVSEFFLRVIYETVEYREKNEIERNDFMDLMIKVKNHENEAERITINEIAAQAFLFFLAGFETSSAVMSFCLYEMAMNPQIQDKLRNEIKKTIKKYGDEINYEAISDIPYLDQVIDETLRKYPAVDSLLRVADKDYKLSKSNHVIPKGNMVLIPVYGFHHDPDYYPDPDKFDPERFSPENKSIRNPFCYLPFGEGPRNCVGMRFGYMQTRIGIIKSLLDYKYSPCEKTPKVIEFDPFANSPNSRNGLWMRIEKA